MISKIDIDNLGVFKNFKWDENVKAKNGRKLNFKKLNIIYGRNYSGKTTLSKIFEAFENGTISEKYCNPQFELTLEDRSKLTQNDIITNKIESRVFNKDFIQRNLSFIYNQDSNRTESITLLGKQNKLIELNIENLQKKLGDDNDNNKTGIYKDLEVLKSTKDSALSCLNDYSKQFSNQLKNKATTSTDSIKNNSEKFGDRNYSITKLKKDLHDVNESTYIELKKAEILKLEALVRSHKKENILPNTKLQIPFSSISKEASNLLGLKINASNKIVELLNDFELSRWVEKGLELNNGETQICKFCGNPISNERLLALNSHFDKVSLQLKDEINKIQEKIGLEKTNLEDWKPFNKSELYETFYLKYEHLCELYNKIKMDCIKQLDSINKQLDLKKEKITNSISFKMVSNSFRELADITKDFDILRIESNNYTEKLSTETLAAKNNLRLNEVLKFSKIINYEESIIKEINLQTASDGINANYEDLLTKKRKIIEEIETEKLKMVDEQKGADKINEYLNNYFNNTFISLKAIEDNTIDGKKTYFKIMRKKEDAYNLSEGECSLIAFCYFMAKLEEANSVKKRLTIWIDDPISSLDSNHIYYTSALIRTIILKNLDDDKYEQVFISTHNMNFLKDFMKKKICSASKQYFVVNRDEDYSKIQRIPDFMKNYSTEFNYLFGEIYKCSQEYNPTNDNYKSFYNFCNNARKFLELYLFFKYPDNSAFNIKLNTFFGSNSNSRILIDNLLNDYSHLNSPVERGSEVLEVPEIHDLANIIMDKLKEDKEQYNAFLISLEDCN